VKIFCFTYGTFDFDPSYCGLSPHTLFAILSEPVVKMRVRSLPMYFPSDEEKNDAALYAENVRAMMREALDIPFSKFSLRERNQRKMSRDFIDVKKLQ